MIEDDPESCEQPLKPSLTVGPGRLPLAALTDEAEPILGGVVRRIEERIQREAPAVLVDKMSPPCASPLRHGVSSPRESPPHDRPRSRPRPVACLRRLGTGGRFRRGRLPRL